MSIRIALLCLLAVLFASCGGEDQYVPRKTVPRKPREVTGILINAQQMEKNVDAAERKVIHWEVVDNSGVSMMSSDDIGAVFKQKKGVMYVWKRAQALKEGRALHLGKNHVEIRIQEVQISGEGVEMKSTFVVDSTGASELRAVPNLKQLVRRAMVVILVGKIGE